MTKAKKAYLALERLAMEADDEGDDFGDFVRDNIGPFWDRLSPVEQAELRSRTGEETDALNDTQVVSKEALHQLRESASDLAEAIRNSCYVVRSPEVTDALFNLDQALVCSTET